MITARWWGVIDDLRPAFGSVTDTHPYYGTMVFYYYYVVRRDLTMYGVAHGVRLVVPALALPVPPNFAASVLYSSKKTLDKTEAVRNMLRGCDCTPPSTVYLILLIVLIAACRHAIEKYGGWLSFLLAIAVARSHKSLSVSSGKVLPRQLIPRLIRALAEWLSGCVADYGISMSLPMFSWLRNT